MLCKLTVCGTSWM